MDKKIIEKFKMDEEYRQRYAELPCSGIRSSRGEDELKKEDILIKTKEGFSVLEGKIITKIEGAEKDSERITFYTKCGKKYLMWHCQDCCESVSVEDICGDVENILETPILTAYKTKNEKHGGSDCSCDNYTWTFYNINTVKGSLTLRWYGSSNGYYSEEVDFEEID